MNELRFILIMALRDARKNYPRLILFISSVIVGIAALVASNSFNYNLRTQIDKEAAALLGADLAVSGNLPADDTIKSLLKSLPAIQAAEKELLSMAYLPALNETQFVRVKAIQKGFPFYGKIKTEPAEGAESFHNGPFALVDESLMLQYGLKTGDSIRLGKYSFLITSKLTGGVGSISFTSAVAPSVYIDYSFLDSTGLVQPGSMVNYAYYFNFTSAFDIKNWKEKNKKIFDDRSLRIESIEDRKNALNRGFGYLNDFLNLTAIIALLLGCLGVASGIWIYAKSKYREIALLRCLGVRSGNAFMIYFIQIVTIALAGSVTGAVTGALIQFLLPLVFQDLLPVTVEPEFSFTAVAQGVMVGFMMSVLFSFMPLASLRQISPLQILRQSFEPANEKYSNKLKYYFLIIAGLFLITMWLTANWKTALVFTLAIVLFYVILFVFAGFLTSTFRKLLPEKAPFSIKQGVSNLFRPDNQTSTVIVTVGMGTAILATLLLVQSNLLKNVALMDADNQPNMIIYGIESSQKAAIRDFTLQYGLPVMQEVPIVTMRIDGWKGKSKAEWLQDSTSAAERWAYNREARVSYRDTISDGETLLDGKLRPYTQGQDSIFVSLGSTFADAMDLKIGDELVFNVQGARIVTYVGSLRDIDFRNFSTRFFIIFPTGVLENAPQFHVLVTKTKDPKTLTRYRAELVKKFPNVSAVDLSSVLQSVNEILAKINFIIRFMALFSLVTGFIVLIGSLTMSKYQRIRESVILRTIGASGKRILAISFWEYFILGVLSVISGVILAVTGSFLILKFKFDLDFFIEPQSLLLLMFWIIGMTVLMGMLNSRSVIRSTPLQVLRKEID